MGTNALIPLLKRENWQESPLKLVLKMKEVMVVSQKRTKTMTNRRRPERAMKKKRRAVKKALLKRAVSPLGAESPVRRNPKDPQKNSNPPRHSLRNPKIYQKTQRRI
jgi:hypothetical protein